MAAAARSLSSLWRVVPSFARPIRFWECSAQMLGVSVMIRKAPENQSGTGCRERDAARGRRDLLSTAASGERNGRRGGHSRHACGGKYRGIETPVAKPRGAGLAGKSSAVGGILRR